MDRSSTTDARTIYDTVLPEMEDRSGALNFYADAIEYAHAENPTSWGITLLKDRIRFNVGFLTIGTLQRDGYWVSLHRDAVTEPVRRELDESPFWTWVDDEGYKQIPTDSGFCTAPAAETNLWETLRKPHLAMVEAVARKWRLLRIQSRQAHSPGALRLLEELTGRTLPRPEFEPVETDYKLEEQLKELPDFDPASIEEGREVEIGNIVRRRGQPEFRKQLLKIYGNRCAVTGCDVVATLEAAHILPYKGPETNHPANGLLLRSDIHTLFDLGQITVDPATLAVEVGSELAGTEYDQYQGQKLTEPREKSLAPSPEALGIHRDNRGLLGSG